MAEGIGVRGQFRRREPPQGVDFLPMALTAETAWSTAFEGVDAVVHLAGLAETPDGRDHVERLQKINCLATLALGRAAAARNLHMVFASTARVFGASGCFDEHSPPAPADAYAASKLQAEEGLRALSGLRLTVLRPPPVYGPGMRGNFRRLLRVVAAGWPLPLGGVRAPRSILFVDNLADLILACLRQPPETARCFAPSDGAPLPLRELLELLADGAGRSPRLLRLPAGMLRATALLGRRGRSLARLNEPFVVSDAALTAFGWRAPLSSVEALRRTGNAALASWGAERE
jgi:UDP-glucose 4-epimerase